MCDEIFGERNFRNEIIWHYFMGGKAKTNFARKHDTLLFYSKSTAYTFNALRQKRRLDFKPSLKDASKNAESGKDEFGYYSIVTMDDVWDIRGVFNMSNEYQGYPTQKPEALLERIIKASSNKDDVVADFFCGCGTAVAVAQKLGRRWIGIDISPTAIKIMQKRLEGTLGVKEGIDYEVIGLPTTVEDVRKLEPFEFQNWVVIDKMRANLTRKKTGDMGLDGYLNKDLYHDAAGIQVKQSDNVCRNVVDNFETALKRAGYKKGYIVAFSFSSGAYEEVARLKNKGELEIKLVMVEELLNKQKI